MIKIKKFKINSKSIKFKLVLIMILVTIFPTMIAGIMTGIIYEWDYVESYDEVFINYLEETDALAEELNKLIYKNAELESFTDVLRTAETLKSSNSIGFIIFKDNDAYYQSEMIEDSDSKDSTIEKNFYNEDSGHDFKLINDRYFVFRELTWADANNSTIEIFFVMDEDLITKDLINFWVSKSVHYIIVLTLFILILFLWTKRSIERPLNSIKAFTQGMEAGDLDTPIVYERPDEFKELALSIEGLRNSLKSSLKQQKNLEEEKSLIIRNVSHDIRTPLTAIRGYVQGIKDGVASDPDTVGEYLDTIQIKVDVIDALINDLKVLSDLDDEISDYQFTNVNMADFLKDCVDEMSFDVKQVGGKIELDVLESQCFIEADPLKLKRVFMNLIENSIKYSSLRELLIRISIRWEDEFIIVKISDNGIGIDKTLSEKIFERFYRADLARGSETGGSGIGLSICKDIIDKHQGFIGAVPNSENGLTIEMKFPRRRL